MNLIELHAHVKKIIDDGVVDPNLPVKFRCDGGKLSSIDYSVIDNEGKSILFAEEWY